MGKSGGKLGLARTFFTHNKKIQKGLITDEGGNLSEVWCIDLPFEA